MAALLLATKTDQSVPTPMRYVLYHETQQATYPALPVAGHALPPNIHCLQLPKLALHDSRFVRNHIRLPLGTAALCKRLMHGHHAILGKHQLYIRLVQRATNLREFTLKTTNIFATGRHL